MKIFFALILAILILFSRLAFKSSFVVSSSSSPENIRPFCISRAERVCSIYLKNFAYMGKVDIPVDTIQDNPDLKECDPVIMELIEHRFQWAEQRLNIDGR